MSTISKSALDEYLSGVIKILLIFIPSTALCAGLTGTGLKLAGNYPELDWIWVIGFDALCLAYFIITMITFQKGGFILKASSSQLRIKGEILLAVILPVQYLILSFIFHETDLWAYSVFFVVLAAFLLSNRFVLLIEAEMAVSLLVSWILKPELLPVHDEHFYANIVLRVVMIILSMISIWFITYLVEKTLLAGVSAQSKQDEVDRVKNEITGIFKESFMGMYVSAYYINLVDCSQLVFCRPEYIEKSYGSMDNYLESITRYILECVHEYDREKMIQVVQPSYIRERLKEEREFSVYMRDISGGHQKWYRCFITRGVDEDHAGLAFTDITQKVAEDEAKAKELQKALTSARSASQYKTDFLNNMSHDIRTPMNAIVSFTDLAMDHISDPDQVKDSLVKISRSSAHLMSLINNVLDISCIESGKMTLCESGEDLCEMVNALRGMIQPDIEKKHMSYVVENNVVNSLVVCDRVRLGQVLMNILSNAVKFTPEGGSVSLKVEQKPSRRIGCASYVFTIKDNGIGMSPEFLEKIFVPFSREENTSVAAVEGAGLGLAITKDLVDLMGGRIGVGSEPGKGSEFTLHFDFKLHTGSKAASARSAASAVDFTGRHLLLVEDNELNIELSRIYLEEAGFLVSVVKDGTEAVDFVSKAAPGDIDVILMDIQMPIMNGYEATRRIRALDSPLSRVPIIALTANAFAEDRQNALDAGMNEHIAKPVDMSLVKRVLSRFL